MTGLLRESVLARLTGFAGLVVLGLLCAVRPALAVAPQSKLTAPDGGGDDRFGAAVAISGDTLAIGALRDDDKGTDAGAVYVFVRSGSAWSFQAKLTASDGQAGDAFGNAVALDGDTLAVGAWRDDDRGTDAGAAYVFQRAGTVWTQFAKLRAGDGVGGDNFGAAVALDIDMAVISAPKDDDKGTNSGSAYVFVRSGVAWNQQAKLLASDGASPDTFGYSVSVSGERAVVGAAFDSNAHGSYAGSAYVFARAGTVWSQQVRLDASDGAANDSFGSGVSIDGTTLLVGAFGDDAPLGNSGSAYVFVWTGSSWVQQAKLTAGDPAANDNFGNAVSLAGDRALVAATLDDDAGADSGSVYLFARTGTVWAQAQKIVAADGAAGDGLGVSVSVSPDSAALGAYLDDDLGADAGSAYVYLSVIPPADGDGDGVPDASDNCPGAPNPGQADGDGDGVGDACDGCPLDPANDADGDLVCGNVDNCPATPNADQLDSDGDGLGDACDVCDFDPQNDPDGDGVCTDVDNCPGFPNPGQGDGDGDGVGDDCDGCPLDPANDADGDGHCANADNCPATPNPDQLDQDGDGRGNACDTCPLDALNDVDGDGICGNVDNCPTVVNVSQTDTDGDGIGDACDTCTDRDGDGYGNPPASACSHGNPLDCNDTNAAVHPGAVEIPNNGIDDDCSAATPGCGQPQLASAGLVSRGGDGESVDLSLYLLPAWALTVAGARLRRRRRAGRAVRA